MRIPGHRLLAFSALVLLATGGGCGPEAAAPPAEAAGGRLVLNVADGGRLLDAPGRALVCARDTTVAVVAMAAGRAAAIAMRSGWPPDVDTFAVDEPRRQPRTAALAVREFGDSITPALTGRHGLLVVRAAERLSGTVEAVAHRPGGDSVVLRGELLDIPVYHDVCP